MFCPKCGSLCDEQNNFCSQCGAPISHAPVVFSLPQIPSEAECVPQSESVDQPEVIPTPKKGSHLPPLIIMAVMLCIGLVCFFLFPKDRNEAALDTPVQKDHFEIYSSTLLFWPEYYTGGASLTVPDILNSMPVLRIGDFAFYDSDMLEEVILPNTVIEICDGAFEECSALRGIYIPGSVYRIGYRAFADCDALEAIYIHNTIQTIEPDAFEGSEAMRHVFFDGTVAQWTDLFRGELPDQVTLYCTDGVFQQHPS